jgi:hypothetical protein
MSLISRFKTYSQSHPNLSHCWISYLKTNKNHYDINLIKQCNYVLKSLANGFNDISNQTIIRLILYKQSISKV